MVASGFSLKTRVAIWTSAAIVGDPVAKGRRHPLELTGFDFFI
jgi:hypothetical protein